MIDISKFKDLFVSEADDHLQRLNEKLLQLEKDTKEPELLNELMRSSHTLKGSSATMGYTSMALLMHVMEDIFDYARTGKLEITTDIINELFTTFDAIGKSLESIKTSGVEKDVQENTDKLKKITNVKTEGTGKSIREEEGTPVTSSGSEEKKEVAEHFDENPLVKGEAVKKVPPTPTGVVSTFKAPTEQESAVEKIEHIKVSVKRLDLLFDLVEELLIDKMRLESIAGRDPELKGVINHLERLISDIQYQVMQARLVPVDQIFARFPRMVRDIATMQKKKIDLQISGGDIELDRTIIDKLGNPLVHLIRNAVDHGIEKEGVIKLNVARDRDVARISVENDGLSINYEKIRKTAIERHIVQKAEAETLTKEQLINILFQPNFSTSETITEISGRGVGLSAVEEFVTEIGGSVLVESPPKDATDEQGNPIPNSGTRFILELPLSLAIVNSLLVVVSGQIFAIPFANILRSVRVPQKHIKSMGDQDVAIVNGSHVALVRLNKVFDLEDTAEEGKDLTVVLVQKGDELAGIVVDTLKDEQEIIAKSLPDSLKGVKGFSGSTILGDGKTIMILDIPGLLADTEKLIRIA